MFGSWGKNVKSAIGGVIGGLVLFLMSFPTLFYFEGVYARREADLNQAKNEMQEANAELIDKAKEGVLVHTVGQAKTNNILGDAEFGVSENALRMQRIVEMYQYREKVKEKKTGSDENERRYKEYSYDQVWSNSPEELTANKAGGRQNPAFPRYEGDDDQTAPNAKLGVYRLSDSLIRQMDNWQNVSPNMEKAGQHIQDQFVVHNGYYYRPNVQADTPPTKPPAKTGDPDAAEADGQTGDPDGAAADSSGDPTNEDTAEANGDPVNTNENTVDPQANAGIDDNNPNIGDIRVSFRAAPATQVSVLAMQKGESFAPWKGGSGTSLNNLEVGSVTGEEMIQAEEAAALMLLWIVRIFGFLAMSIGIFVMLYPLQAIANIMPMLGSLVGVVIGFISLSFGFGLALTTIAIAWVYYRPLYGILILAIGVGLIGFGIFIVSWFRGGSKDKDLDLQNA